MPPPRPPVLPETSPLLPCSSPAPLDRKEDPPLNLQLQGQEQAKWERSCVVHTPGLGPEASSPSKPQRFPTGTPAGVPPNYSLPPVPGTRAAHPACASRPSLASCGPRGRQGRPGAACPSRRAAQHLGLRVQRTAESRCPCAAPSSGVATVSAARGHGRGGLWSP